eukprot:CAMPEP_0197692274 /NCGR_PEP_ID=MMETSP1338-20131121/110853_1 /TAXON_ID=43686 ORGANISM="Pelagodinium beii, Strain RCC1491" /NCGR_SAMPLE_ID=MMETSP1338 /ASSEMBLY_ACC=CAM_ASM_000754 /LENGTH=338 /DNA_ID=CAMNT_0043274911 /DNA_START=40 /DNA_END=1056 /DNA_ORIENTATION=+
MAGYGGDSLSASGRNARNSAANVLLDFEKVEDFGLYTWSPQGLSQKKKFSDVNEQDVITGLASGEDAAPPRLKRVASISVPLKFATPAPQAVPNIFPYDAGYIVPLHVALQRRGSLDGIDFLLGGSSLEILAQKKPIEEGTKYLTQRCPGTEIILLCKHKQYVQNYADVGFQFERLLTGQRMDGRHDVKKIESLHVMKIGGFNVLFSADVDAVDEEGCPVEMKTGNPMYFGTKVMFQMLSSGSKTMIRGDVDKRSRPPVLNRIQSVPLETMIQQNSATLQEAQKNIQEGLTILKHCQEIKEDEVGEVDFSNGRLIVMPRSSSDILPRRAVVEQLLREP